MKVRAILIVVLLLVLSAGPAFAQGTEGSQTLEELIVSLYASSVRIVGLVAFLMILYAGIRRLMGDAQESNRIIIDAIIGTVLLLSAVVILQSINRDLVEQEPIFNKVEQRTIEAGVPKDALERLRKMGTTVPQGGAIYPIVVQ